MKKAVVLIAEGSEELEAVTVIDILRRGGVETCAMSIDGELVVPCSRGVSLLADSGWDTDIIDDADALIAPGGMGGMKLMCGTHAVLKAFSKTNERGKLVAAICAGPVLLAKAGVLKGRKATCYPGMENEISEGGAAPSKGNVVTDGNVITSRGPGTSAEFALAVLRSLHGDEIAGKAAEGLLL